MTRSNFVGRSRFTRFVGIAPMRSAGLAVPPLDTSVSDACSPHNLLLNKAGEGDASEWKIGSEDGRPSTDSR